MKKFYLLIAISYLCLSLKAQLNISSNNYVGIGVSSPIAPLHVNGNVYIPASSSYWINSTSDNGVRLRLHNNGYGNYIDFYPFLNFRTSSNSTGLSNSPLYLTYGRVGINNGYPSCALDVIGTIKMNGATVTCDERFKENIRSMTGILDQLTSLRGVTYKLKPLNVVMPTIASLYSNSIINKDTTNFTPPKLQGIDSVYFSRNHMGFLAQEVQTVFPDLVYKDKNGVLSVDYISLIPVLVESIKEQQVTINDLKAAIAELNKKLSSQKPSSKN